MPPEQIKYKNRIFIKNYIRINSDQKTPLKFTISKDYTVARVSLSTQPETSSFSEQRKL